MADYQPTIGMEIHIELATASKMFCDCPNNPDETKPNTNVCPVCLGMPGVLPTINKKAVEQVIKVGLALGGEIAKFSKWDRKNYFYPDLPKGYQISQYDLPISNGGKLKIDGKEIRIRRIHLEEDTGKLLHPVNKNHSLIDYNRAGVPLMELVTEPDITTPAQAKMFCQQMQLILRHLNVSDADMEKGQMRAEANISLSQNSELGTKVEIKNLNSFRAVERALLYEIERQKEKLQKGEKIIQETRGWNADKNITYPQRLKETEADYRYFPEPDLPPLTPLEVFQIGEIKKSIPKLPIEIQEELSKKYGLSLEQAYIIVNDKKALSYFGDLEKELGQNVQSAITWIINENLGYSIAPADLKEFIEMLKTGEISGKMGKEIIVKMRDENKSASQIIKEGGLKHITDEDQITEVVKKVIVANSEAVSDYRKGKEPALKYLIGQVMKETKGQANPEIVAKILKEQL